MKRRSLASILVLGLAIVLTACPGTPNPTSSAFEGLWLLTPDEGTALGSGGTTTVAFGGADNGELHYLSRHDGHGLTTCEAWSYQIDRQAGTVTWQGAPTFGFTLVGDDEIRLEQGDDGLTLTRVTGAPPVQPCGRATSEQTVSFTFAASGFSTLNAVGSRLYLNVDDAGQPIVAYDVALGSTGAPRTYGTVVDGGIHRYVMGARSDDLFYGHCGCGGSRSVGHFNLDLGTSLAYNDIVLVGGETISVRFGTYTGASFLAGGHSSVDSQRNVLVELNQDTLAFVARRDVLTGLQVSDIVMVGGELIALSGNRLLYIGSDGRAERTVHIEGLPGSAGGLAAVGGEFYVLIRSVADRAALHKLTLD